MAVYVDNFYLTPMSAFGRMKMSHMIADTRQELFEMVDKIGVQRKWIQGFNTTREHFDVSKGRREAAIKAGAIPVNYRELAEMTRTRTYEGKTQVY